MGREREEVKELKGLFPKDRSVTVKESKIKCYLANDGPTLRVSNIHTLSISGLKH